MKHERYYSSMKLNGGLTVGRKHNGPAAAAAVGSKILLRSYQQRHLRSQREDGSQQWHDADVEDRE